jgi:hypothetical protein
MHYHVNGRKYVIVAMTSQISRPTHPVYLRCGDSKPMGFNTETSTCSGKLIFHKKEDYTYDDLERIYENKGIIELEQGGASYAYLDVHISNLKLDPITNELTLHFSSRQPSLIIKKHNKYFQKRGFHASYN